MWRKKCLWPSISLSEWLYAVVNIVNLENLGLDKQPYLQGVWRTELSNGLDFLRSGCLNFFNTWQYVLKHI